MYQCRNRNWFLSLAVLLFACFLPNSAAAQVNAYNCTNCAVYDLQNTNNVILTFHYYCSTDNNNHERAEVYYAKDGTFPPRGFVTSDNKFILKGRVNSSYAIFYNSANQQVAYSNATFSTGCRQKLASAQITTSAANAGTLKAHTLDTNFAYNLGMNVIGRGTNNIPNWFEIRGTATATSNVPPNGGSATNAALVVNAQEKFDMATPPASFRFKANTLSNGWLMGGAGPCPRLSGQFSSSDWLFTPVFNKIQTACNDGIDNDGDGLIDFPQDPGCSSANDTTETAQCSDGLDNDSDGATDFPADFSCASPNDDDETNPKAQCQDGLDNDGDGLIDFPADPGCTSKQDNNERGTTQCDDGIDNDGDGKIDFPTDPGCSSPSDNSENSENVPPAPPTNVQASDGTQIRRIDVTWNASPGANSYNLYRSENPNAFNDPNFSGIIAPNISGTSYNDSDPALEPGVKYYYSVKAVNTFGTSGFATPDSGFALCKAGHCDCDDVSDVQEQADGTNQCDGGDFVLHLKSPAFTKYNTFLSQSNFLELIASGNKDVSVLVTVYTIGGAVKAQTTIPLGAGTQFDVDINTLVGQKDTYGLVRIDFDDQTPGSSILGRISNYRLDPGASTYSFAFTKELRNTTNGSVFAASNSIDPQGQGFLVPNWLEVMNVEDSVQRFTYRLYGQDGRLLSNQIVNISPRGEQDIQAGHENGQGVYLVELIPDNPNARYFATVSRYSSNAFGGNEASTYNFAFSVEARKGTGSAMFAPTTNRTGATWVQTNWVEVANTRDTAVEALVEFRNGAGGGITSQTMTLAPKSQFHFNAGGVLGTQNAATGSVRISSTMPNSLITTSMVYFHDKGNFLQTAYISLARIPGPSKQAGSVNSFIQMRNELTLVNASNQAFAASVDVTPFGLSPLPTATVNFGSSAASITSFDTFPIDRYGTLRVSSPSAGLVAGEILRVREIGGKVDFAFPTAVQ